jgi:hypothetical protein
MSKLISATLITTFLFFTPSHDSNLTLAGTCASQCGPRPIQFTPGQYIRLQVINKTGGVVKIEKFPEMKQVSIESGQEFQIDQENATQENLSVVFWNDKGWPLQGVVSKPNFGTLRLEIRPARSNPGDRSLYILNDGRVNVF